jgi:hypothetical protein
MGISLFLERAEPSPYPHDRCCAGLSQRLHAEVRRGRGIMLGGIVARRFESFSAFYPVYLIMHAHPTNRRLHVAGNLLGLGAIGLAMVLRTWWILAAAPLFASGLAWIGHRYFEKNRPGVLTYPIYGTLGSWRMTWDLLTGRSRPMSPEPRR